MDPLHIDATSAKEFLEALDPSEKPWIDGDGTPWLYRGETNDTRPLLPSAWRKTSGFAALAKVRGSPRVCEMANEMAIKDDMCDRNENGRIHLNRIDYYKQTLAELQIISSFADVADSISLNVQMETKILTPERYKKLHDKRDGRRGPVSYRPSRATALAQHHGVPTRLLDFTWSPFVAAFFASHSTKQITSTERRIVVYAIQSSALGKSASGLWKFTVPRYQFDFLHAQHGLFLYLDNVVEYQGEQGDWPSLDWKLQTTGYPPIKVTLPATHVPELCERLARHHYSYAHMMPSFDNVKKTLVDRGDLVEGS